MYGVVNKLSNKISNVADFNVFMIKALKSGEKIEKYCRNHR